MHFYNNSSNNNNNSNNNILLHVFHRLNVLAEVGNVVLNCGSKMTIGGTSSLKA